MPNSVLGAGARTVNTIRFLVTQRTVSDIDLDANIYI